MSTAIYNFSTRHKGRAQEPQRSAGHSPNMPTLQEVDDMLEQSRRANEALSHIRDVLQMQQSVADHRAHESGYNKSSTEYDMEDAGVYHDDMKANGMMGPDPKKRRGVSLQTGIRGQRGSTNSQLQRAAPPGRCHSCNRAETPEWRRGPDGARTLCNACGLRKSSQRVFGKELGTLD
jgi:hypothetical protein